MNAGVITKAASSAISANAFATGINAYGTYMDYQGNRKQGDSVPISVAKAGANFALGEVLGGYYLGFFAATSVAKGMYEIGKNNSREMNKVYASAGKLGSGNSNINSQYAYTMRQRSMAAMQQNGANVSSLFGNEARTYFRGAGY